MSTIVRGIIKLAIMVVAVGVIVGVSKLPDPPATAPEKKPAIAEYSFLDINHSGDRVGLKAARAELTREECKAIVDDYRANNLKPTAYRTVAVYVSKPCRNNDYKLEPVCGLNPRDPYQRGISFNDVIFELCDTPMPPDPSTEVKRPVKVRARSHG